jgi:hypothetical protein
MGKMPEGVLMVKSLEVILTVRSVLSWFNLSN